MTLVAQKLRDSAGHHNAYCTIQSPVCGDATDAKTAGCVLCHWRLPGESGGAQKPDDTCAGLGCVPCHTWMDSNGTTKGPERMSEEWLFYTFRSTVRTLRFWRENGFISIKGVK